MKVYLKSAFPFFFPISLMERLSAMVTLLWAPHCTEAFSQSLAICLSNAGRSRNKRPFKFPPNLWRSVPRSFSTSTLRGVNPEGTARTLVVTPLPYSWFSSSCSKVACLLYIPGLPLACEVTLIPGSQAWLFVSKGELSSRDRRNSISTFRLRHLISPSAKPGNLLTQCDLEPQGNVL